MSETKTIPRKDVTGDLKTILLSMENEDNQLQELILPVSMIEDYCTQKRPFAHDLDGQPYMRCKIDDVTLEFLVLNAQEGVDYEQARVCQISRCYKLIYRRPRSPVGTICIT